MDQQTGKNLVVALAGADYLDQAKALFSSIYWNAGWTGDYMLLAHGIPENDLEWFQDKKILVYRCEPLITSNIGNYPATVLDKLYLFKSYFKKWRTVIYLDSDIIPRASLDELTKVKGFAAVKDLGDYEIGFNFSKDNKELYEQLCHTYAINRIGFNSGLIAFNTDIIEGDKTFRDLMSLMNKYLPIANGDQPLLNLFFNEWDHLPRVYNVSIPDSSKIYRQLIQSNPKALFHFGGYYKPWHKEHFIHSEWIENFKKAEEIDLSKPVSSLYPITQEEILDFENSYDELKEAINFRLELSNLYRLDKKQFRKRVSAEVFKRNPLKMKRAILYYFVSLLPEGIKNGLRTFARMIGLLPKDLIVIGKLKKQANN